MRARWRGVVGVALAGSVMAVLAASTVTAAGLVDPTQPPAQLRMSAVGTGAIADIQQPVLQSVMISQAQRRAMISGQTVVVGGQYQDARVVKISEGEVVLKRGNELQTLKLFPDLQKHVVSGLHKTGSAGAAHPKPRR